MMEDQVEFLGTQGIALDGPFKLEAQILFVGTTGEYDGYDAWATFDLPVGKVPDDAAIIKGIEAAQASLGDKFRLATREEFMRNIIAEKTGVNVNVSVPGPKEFRLQVAQSEQANG